MKSIRFGRNVLGDTGTFAANRDSGETTTQVVLVVPVVISILLIGVQATVYFHTSNIAGAAASQGASSAAAHGDTAGSAAEWGRGAAMAITQAAGAATASPPDVLVSPQSVTIAVVLRVPRIIPYFPATVRRVATEPRERFLTESMR